MIGIKSYGGYIPFYRIKKTDIANAYGKRAKGGEKAVAYYDEDSLTMAVGAAMNAVKNADGKYLDAVCFATTTSPYQEKQCSSQIAAVLDCDHAVRTADFSNSLKSCSDAMLMAQERSSQPDYFRGYKKNHAMYGSVCTECGTPHYPPQRVCAICRAVDKMEPYRFIGKKAWLRTFTLDGVALSLDSPNILVVVEFEGGGKMMTFLVESTKEEMRVKMPVKLSFRRMFQADGVNTYFWKVVPCREMEDV